MYSAFLKDAVCMYLYGYTGQKIKVAAAREINAKYMNRVDMRLLQTCERTFPLRSSVYILMLRASELLQRHIAVGLWLVNLPNF